MPASRHERHQQERRLSSLVASHAALVAWLLRRWGVCEADLDDAAQQVFCILNGKLAAVPSGRERAFLAACAVNVALRWRRSRSRRLRREISSELVCDLSDSGGNPEKALEERQRLAELDALLGRLPGELRSVYVLRAVEGLTNSEIARALSIPPGTVASRLRLARRRFAAALSRARRSQTP